MGQGTEASEPTCAADRPTEVSVIRFVSRNRTIEEPKKELYECKAGGCSKKFTNLEEYKNHETLETLKIRFTCKEDGCGKELPDPGRMWWHYQESHNNGTEKFVCPYTRCGSEHETSELLEVHIENTHRQQPTIPTEPEIICFEGAEHGMEEDVTRITGSENGFDSERNVMTEISDSVMRQNEYSIRSESIGAKQLTYSLQEENIIISSQTHQSEDYPMEQSKLRAALIQDNYSKNNESANNSAKIPKNKDLLITKENFLVKYESRSPVCSSDNVLVDSSVDGSNVVYINNDVSLTRTTNQEHRIDMGNLEKVFRSGFEQDSAKMENVSNGLKNHCSSNDEEYTPKKQRMSRSKQEPYKCEINGCGKTYKYISYYRHHQDSHKLAANAMNTNLSKSTKPKSGKPAMSFVICKVTGCGAQLNNVVALYKHYQDFHPNTKPPAVLTKSTEMYRCKITGCEMEFTSSLMLHKHFNEVHSKNSINNASANLKTANGSGVLVKQVYHDDSTAQRVNFKTDLKAKHSLNEYTESNNKNNQSSIIKNETGD